MCLSVSLWCQLPVLRHIPDCFRGALQREPRHCWPELYQHCPGVVPWLMRLRLCGGQGVQASERAEQWRGQTRVQDAIHVIRLAVRHCWTFLVRMERPKSNPLDHAERWCCDFQYRSHGVS